MEQRLTAILALDMVGYSRLMEADELGTIVRHKEHREALIDPVIDRFGGRIVKEMGDGLLVEFTSISGAVRCAVEIQRAMPTREVEFPTVKRISYRIGINLGDIVYDGHEVYGDGINVAARLEQMAEPDGICISGTAHDTLRESLDVAYRPLGPMSVKNINRPIQVYKIELDPPSNGEEETHSSQRWFAGRASRWSITIVGAICAIALVTVLVNSDGYFREVFVGARENQSEVPISIAMMPFRDLSEAGGSSYLSAGISEDLATELSAAAELLLITLSTPATNGTDFGKMLQTVEGLGVDYVLSGTVRRDNASSSVDVVLGSVAREQVILEKDYRRETDTLASVGQDISADIIASIPNLQPRAEVTRDPTYHFPDPAAYDFLLQGNVELARFNPTSLDAAEALYIRAAEADPKYARPNANIAFVRALKVAFGWSRDPEVLARQATAIADAALRTDPTVHQAYLAKGLLARSRRQYENAISEFERAIEIAPNSADAYAMVALTQVFAGDPEGGLISIEKAIDRNPDHPFNYLYTKGVALFNMEKFDDASVLFEDALARNPGFLPARLAYVSTLSHLGRVDEAAWELEEVLVRQPEFTLLREQVRTPYANINDTLRYIQGLKVAVNK